MVMDTSAPAGSIVAVAVAVAVGVPVGGTTVAVEV